MKKSFLEALKKYKEFLWGLTKVLKNNLQAHQKLLQAQSAQLKQMLSDIGDVSSRAYASSLIASVRKSFVPLLQELCS